MITFLIPETIPEWQAWCRDYERETIYPVGGAHIRYGIGIYQIYQAMGWSQAQAGTGVESKADHESLAAAATHILMAAESWKAPTEVYLKPDLLTAARVQPDWAKLLYHISAAQQMFFYGYVASMNTAARSKSRFKIDILAQHAAAAIEILILAIPVLDRPAAFEDATKIMTGRL